MRSKSPARVEPRVDREATALARAGHDVHVLLWDRTKEYDVEEYRAGYTIHRLRLRAPESQLGLLPPMARWWCWEFRKLHRLDADVVHSCDFDTLVPAAIYTSLKGKKLVYDIFDFYAYMIAQPLGPNIRERIAAVERRFARMADLVVMPDRARTVQLGRGFSGRIEEIMNVPIDVRVDEEEEKEFTIFYGGMLSHERGLRQLVEATTRAEVRLVVAGHGGDEATLIPLFQGSPHVRYLGNIPYIEVLKWSARCHLIAALYDPTIPNNRLASPNKLFEAMMLSRPVVTTEGTRPAQVVREVGCGTAVGYDDVQGLAEAIKRLAGDPNERRTMGTNGRRAFEDSYNWPVMEKRLVEAYASL